MNPRYFVGIFPPYEVGEELARTTDTLDASLPEARLKISPASDIHLTLRFIGELPQGIPDGLESSLTEVAKRYRTFDLRPAGIGGFPSTRKVRIVWAGVGGEGRATLTRLAREIEESVVEAGLEREKRPFRPHFTLARSRSPISLNDLGFEPEEFPAFGVGGFVLASNPAPGSSRHGRAVYERVAEFVFAQ